MSLVDLVRDAVATPFPDEDGEPDRFEAAPPLSPDAIAALDASLPCPLPADLRALLGVASGLSGPGPEVDLSGGLQDAVDLGDVVPHAFPVAADGFGNFWVVDLVPGEPTWGPVLFACHDPSVVMVQAPTLEAFLRDVVAVRDPTHVARTDDAHRDAGRVEDTKPGRIPHAAGLASDDPVLRSLAERAGPDFDLVDLRAASVGDGFAWPRDLGEHTVLRAWPHRVFAVRTRFPPPKVTPLPWVAGLGLVVLASAHVVPRWVGWIGGAVMVAAWARTRWGRAPGA